MTLLTSCVISTRRTHEKTDFMTAGVPRHNKKSKLNITWEKDRGKDVASAPWFNVFKGERINNHYLSLAKKMAARGSA